MRLRLVANVRREQSKLDGLLANVWERLRTLAFIERRAGSPVEIKIMRVISLSTAELLEITHSLIHNSEVVLLILRRKFYKNTKKNHSYTPKAF